MEREEEKGKRGGERQEEEQRKRRTYILLDSDFRLEGTEVTKSRRLAMKPSRCLTF